MIEIREEQPEDEAAIPAVNEEAFSQPAEARIGDELRGACDGLLSLVAVDAEAVVGHILFSPVTIDGHEAPGGGMGLAPMAVLPKFQRRGGGSSLVRAGLAKLRSRWCPFVIVLGHPEYYPHFDFEPASKHGLRSPWDGGPDEAFTGLVFDEPALKNASGIDGYRTESAKAM